MKKEQMKQYLCDVFEQFAHGFATLALGSLLTLQLFDYGLNLARQSAHRLLVALDATVDEQRLLVVET